VLAEFATRSYGPVHSAPSEAQASLARTNRALSTCAINHFRIGFLLAMVMCPRAGPVWVRWRQYRPHGCKPSPVLVAHYSGVAHRSVSVNSTFVWGPPGGFFFFPTDLWRIGNGSRTREPVRAFFRLCKRCFGRCRSREYLWRRYYMPLSLGPINRPRGVCHCISCPGVSRAGLFRLGNGGVTSSLVTVAVQIAEVRLSRGKLRSFPKQMQSRRYQAGRGVREPASVTC